MIDPQDLRIVRETMNVQEAAAFLHVGTETLEELVDAGAVMAAKIGMKLVFHVDDLRSYLRAEAERQTAERRDYTRKIAAGQMARSERPSVDTAAGKVRRQYGKRGKLPDLGAAA